VSEIENHTQEYHICTWN